MRISVVGLAVSIVACGGDTGTAAPMSETSTGTSGDDGFEEGGGAVVDLPWEPLPDLPPENRSCEERGTQFGIVAGPQVIEGAFDPVAIDHVSLTAGMGGLLVTYSRYNPELSSGDHLAVRVALDGSAKGQPWSLAISSDAPAGAAADERTLLSYCHEGVIGWRAFDAAGAPQGPALVPPSFSACPGDPAAAAWTDTGYLAAWRAAPSLGCVTGCIAVASGNENVVFSARSVAPTVLVTSPVAIAAADNAALVVASQVNDRGDNELLMALVSPVGVPLFPPIVEPLPNLDDRGPATSVPVAVSATDDDGFLVVVGGRGHAIGRLRLNKIASIREPYEDVPFPTALSNVDAFRAGIELTPRVGGFVAHGRAQEEDPLLLLLMLDDDGEVQGYESFPNAADAGITTFDGRTWVAFGGETLSLAELGCVF